MPVNDTSRPSSIDNNADPNRTVRAAVVCVGTELTEGIVQDSHVQRIGRLLFELGIELVSAHILPDTAAEIEDRVRRLTADVDLLLLAGGLGPTSDDLTRDCVAAAAGIPLDFHEETWQRLQEWGQRFGRRIADANRRQALVPRGFEVIPNKRGTAPGFAGPVRGCLVIALPGPPGELVPMLDGEVAPRLSRRFRLVRPEPQTASVFGVGESDLEEGLQKDAAGFDWSTRVEGHRIVVTLRGAGGAAAAFEALTRRFGGARVVRGDVRPGELVLPLLTNRGLTVVCAESCTGGGVTALLTDVAGSSAAVWGGFVTYANEAKLSALGVADELLEAYGAVSQECVKAMCAGALRASGADFAVAISGVAGPGGGTKEKPVGTVWIAWQRRDTPPEAEKFRFPGDREAVRRRAAVASLVGLRLRLLNDADKPYIRNRDSG